jgi:phage shock protein PspC (stress-responsive transcriptional regulator)
MQVVHEPLHRPAHGHIAAGVCAGLAARLGLPVAAVRAATLALALVGGIGVVAYLAGWIVLPAEEGQERGRSAVASLALLVAAAAGMATLAAVAAAATVFGFGVAVAAAAGGTLLAVVLVWPRLHPAWALVPVAALVVPALALAGAGVRLVPQAGDVAVAPRTAADIPVGGYRSGLGMLVIDLRRTALPAAGSVRLRIDAGVRRTIVALPHTRCVVPHVRLERHGFARCAIEALTRSWSWDGPGGALSLFGEPTWGDAFARSGTGHGLRLDIDVRTAGGPVVVRDWPDDVDPASDVNWPGYRGGIEPRPDTAGLSRGEARRMLRAWRARRDDAARRQRTVARLIGGPCKRERRR